VASSDLSDPRIDAIGMLVEAHHELVGGLARELQERCSLPLSFFEVLLRLARSPDHQLRLNQLACESTLTISGLSRLVDRLEQAGLIERRPCASDRRGALVTITREGRRQLDVALAVHLDGLDRRLTAHLDAAELGQLTHLLRRLRDAQRDSRTRC
jgi:MarR family 2-MHQ and catechol resistance regulon transcriptional repressor